MDEKKSMRLSTLIALIRNEIGRREKAVEKQEQEFDKLEQFGRLNCLILHGNDPSRFCTYSLLQRFPYWL